MEFESIIVAIITGAFAVIGQWLIARENKRKADTEQAVKDAKMEMQISEILKRLDEHNSYAAKFSATAERLARIEQRLEDVS